MVNNQDKQNKRKTAPNLFDIIPVGFFNYLASNSNHRIYADCLQVIYDEYDRKYLIGSPVADCAMPYPYI